MVKTIIRRFIILIPQLFLIMTFAFWLGWMMPGDFVSQQIGGERTWSELMEERERLGLDDPWYMQFGRWLTSMARFDLGISARHHRSVWAVIGDRLPNTMILSFATMALLLPVSLILGILAGRFSGSMIDRGIILYGFIGMSLPNIVYAILLIWLFSFQLGWFPSRGSVDVMIYFMGTPWEIFVSRVQHLFLPVIAGGTLGGIGLIYTMRAQVIDGRGSDYATTARAKGVPTRVIFNKHIMRNSLIPFAGLFGGVITGLFSGSIFIEMIFSYPGMGTLFLDSMNARDFAVVNGIIMINVFLGVVSVLVSDIALTIIDPRIQIK